MTLAFSTQIKGQPTHFVSKIVIGLVRNNIISAGKASELLNIPITDIKYSKQISKIHSTRNDVKDRWNTSRMIDFVINNRTKYRTVFAPRLPVISTQEVEIWNIKDLPAKLRSSKSKITLTYLQAPAGQHTQTFMIKIDDYWLPPGEMEQLAFNDGFNSIAEMIDWFSNSSWKGKLIHWTDFKYTKA